MMGATDILKAATKPLCKVTEKLAPVWLKVGSKTPEMLLTGGIAAITGGTVLACVTTWKKLPARVDEMHDELTDIDMRFEKESDQAPAKTKAYLQAACKVAVDYVPSVLLMGGGIMMVVGSHNQLRSRLGALGAAYATLEAGYSEYRGRVIEQYGEDVDRKFRLGIREEEIKYMKELKNGKEKEVTEVVEAVHADGEGYSMYARYFDQFNSNMHVRDQEANFDFLRLQQNIANEKLDRKGYLFLNEVYDALGFKEIPEGQLVGWVKGYGDGFVDFGLFEARNADARNYVDYNGKETCFVLDFNVDGLMWDLI